MEVLARGCLREDFRIFRADRPRRAGQLRACLAQLDTASSAVPTAPGKPDYASARVRLRWLSS